MLEGFRCGVRCAEQGFWRLCVVLWTSELDVQRCLCADCFVGGVDQDISELIDGGEWADAAEGVILL